MISKKLSDSLRIANVICTLLVIAIHYNTKHDMDLANGYTWNYYIQELLTNGIARIAVPFFALVAGFFFFLSYKGISSYPNSVRKRVDSLLVPYLLASLIIFIVEYVYGVIQWDLSIDNVTLLIRDVVVNPVSVQFWFLRDLMFLVLLSPLIFVLMYKFKLWVIVPVMMLWFFDIEIMPLVASRYLITIETLSFFMMGCYFSYRVDMLNKLISTVSAKVIFVALFVYLALCVVRIILEPDMANWYTDKYQLHSLIIQNTSIIIGVFLVVLLSSKILNDKLIYLSQFTFFAYIFHLMPLSHLVGKLTSYVISDAYKFYLTFPLATIMVFSGAFFCKMITPNLYKLLSGNR